LKNIIISYSLPNCGIVLATCRAPPLRRHAANLSYDLKAYAKANSTCYYKLAAAVISGGRVISIGCNQPSTIMKNGRWLIGDHAEVNALKKAREYMRRRGKQLRRHIVVVAHSQFGNSNPCVNCAQALLQSGASRVYYTNGIRTHGCPEYNGCHPTDIPHYLCKTDLKFQCECADTTEDADSEGKDGQPALRALHVM
jgi:deoxycytidylate deaminase